MHQASAQRRGDWYGRQSQYTNHEGARVPEKSPQKPAGKKPGKSLKEKRDAKREKKEKRS